MNEMQRLRVALPGCFTLDKNCPIPNLRAHYVDARTFGSLGELGLLIVGWKGVRTLEYRRQILAKWLGEDDFIGDLIADEWVLLSGSDGQALDPVLVAGSVGGLARLTGGNSGVNVAADGSQLCTAVNFQADKGDLAFECRVKIDVITNLSVFVGFTDIITLEAPIESAASANTILSNATDAVGLFFDTSMTDDNWWAAGVANGTDATHVDSGIPPVAAAYQVLRVELDASGNAKMYIDGNLVADVDDAVTATVAQCATAFCYARTAVTRLVDLDYMLVEQDR